MRPWVVLLLSALGGYLALSQEIIWVHALSFATGGRPQVFAHVIGMYLLGVALGSLWVGRHTLRPGHDGRLALPWVLLVSGALSYLALPALARLFVTIPEQAMLAAWVLVAVLAFASGSAFPLLCHLGIDRERAVGASLSRVYFANIVGSAGGPLLTTFVLMDVLPLASLVRWVASATVALALLAALGTSVRGRALAALAAAAVAFGALASLAHEPLYAQLYERLQLKDIYSPRHPFQRLVERRGGVISVDDNVPPMVSGGGIYDGRVSVDPIHDMNIIRRAYLVASLHPAPAEMLTIGLSTGAWGKVMLGYEPVRTLDAVEINPAYLDVIRSFPEQAAMLDDPKLTMHVDDGRRWLNRNPDRRFDFILSNTTLFWRSSITNLLSKEFFELCQRRLKPGGVVYVNSTQSPDVAATAARVFQHVVVYKHMVAASDAPFALTEDERRGNLRKFVIDGQRVLDGDAPEVAAVREELATVPLADQREALLRDERRRVITDDNMVTEFQPYGPVARPRGALTALWKKLTADAPAP